MGNFYPPSEEALSLAVEYVMGCGVPGDIVEFGCYRGRTSMMLAGALQEMGKKYDYSDRMHGITERRLWLFDSFEGFPKTSHAIDAASPHIRAGVWFAGAPAGGTPDEVRALCAQYIAPERILVIAGWYKDTLHQLPPGQKFAVVHVDCDYYESTFQVLDHLFGNDMMSDGCTVLFDDWYCNRGSPDFGEQKAWSDAVMKHDIRSTDWGPYGVVGRRFIIHGKQP
jgi:hypothetical protein